MEKGFYHQSVGYWQTISEPSESLLASYPPGTIEVPLKPGNGYIYNGSEWVAPSLEWVREMTAAQVRQERDIRLHFEVDPIISNPLRWEDLPDTKKQEWISYRRQLLDITLQENFPFDIVWPTKP